MLIKSVGILTHSQTNIGDDNIILQKHQHQKIPSVSEHQLSLTKTVSQMSCKIRSLTKLFHPQLPFQHLIKRVKLG